MIVTMRTRIRWAVAAALGLAAGATVSSLVVAAVGRPLSPILGGLLYVALYGAIIGGVSSVVQLAIIPRGAVRWDVWTIANIAGFALGYVLASLVGESLGALVDPGLNLIVGEGLIEDASGAVLGLAIGLAQWLVLQRARPRLRWLVATAVGVGLGYGSAAAVLELFEIPVLKTNLIPSFGAIVGLFLGVAQATALRTKVSARATSN